MAIPLESGPLRARAFVILRTRASTIPGRTAETYPAIPHISSIVAKQVSEALCEGVRYASVRADLRGTNSTGRSSGIAGLFLTFRMLSVFDDSGRNASRGAACGNGTGYHCPGTDRRCIADIGHDQSASSNPTVGADMKGREFPFARSGDPTIATPGVLPSTTQNLDAGRDLGSRSYMCSTDNAVGAYVDASADPGIRVCEKRPEGDSAGERALFQRQTVERHAKVIPRQTWDQ